MSKIEYIHELIRLAEESGLNKNGEVCLIKKFFAEQNKLPPHKRSGCMICCTCSECKSAKL